MEKMERKEELETEMLLYSIVKRATKLLKGKGGGMYLYDQGKGEMRCVVSYNTKRDYRGVTLKLGEGAAGRVAQTGQPLIIKDYRYWEGRGSIFERDQPFTAVISAPMKWQDELLGVIHVLDDVEERTFNEDDLQLLTTFADQAAVTVRNAQLYQESQHMVQELTALHEVSSKIVAQFDLSKLLQTIVQHATELLKAKGGGIYLLCEAKEAAGKRDMYDRSNGEKELELILSYNLSRDYTGTRLKLGEGLAGRVAQSGEPMVVKDYKSWEGMSARYAGEPLATVIAIPLKYEDKVIGVLNISDEKERDFTEDDLKLAALFANQAAIAIENTKLYEKLRGSEEFHKKLVEISGEIFPATEIKKILQDIAEAIIKYSPFKLAAISLYDRPIDPLLDEDHKIVDLFIAGLPAEEEQKLREIGYSGKFILDRKILKHGIKIGNAYYVSAENLPEIVEKGVRGLLPEEKLKGWDPYDTIYLFLYRGGKVIGRIALADPIHGQIPTEEEIKPLELLANLATIALEKAQMIKELKELAIRDPLTGLYNRHYFNEVIGQEFKRAKRYKHPFCLLLVDMDNLKEINNRFGHLAGDQALCEVAQILCRSFRSADMIFRYGGDEFLILLAQTEGHEAARRLKEAVEEWNGKNNPGFRLGLSIGSAVWRPNEGKDLNDILQEADRLMYVDKLSNKSKKNCDEHGSR